MSGTNVENPEGRGINYRALEDLFDMVEDRREEVGWGSRQQLGKLIAPAVLSQAVFSKHPRARVPIAFSVRVLQTQYQIKVQMLEIYNESLRDLFRAGGAQAAKLELLNTQASGCNVRNAEQVGRSTMLQTCCTDVGVWNVQTPCFGILRPRVHLSRNSNEAPPHPLPTIHTCPHAAAARSRWRAPLWLWSSWPGGLGTDTSLRPT